MAMEINVKCIASDEFLLGQKLMKIQFMIRFALSFFGMVRLVPENMVETGK